MAETNNRRFHHTRRCQDPPSERFLQRNLGISFRSGQPPPPAGEDQIQRLRTLIGDAIR